MLTNVWQDLRYGARMLLKNPVVTVVAVFTLALGIGANTAIFSGVNAFLLRPLPVPEPDQIVRPVEITEDRGLADEFSYPDFADYRDQTTVFEGLVAENMTQAVISAENQNDVIWGQTVSGNFFDVLRVKPILGRTFTPDEDKTLGTHAVVVIGHNLWQRRFASDSNIVGKTINLNNRPYNVIGVAPETFKGTKFALALDFWAPMAMVEELERSPNQLKERGSHWMNVFARLKPGVSLDQASSELSAIAQRLNQAYPDDRANTTRVKVQTEIDGRWDEAAIIVKSGSAIAMAIVGFILLIVAGLNEHDSLLTQDELRSPCGVMPLGPAISSLHLRRYWVRALARTFACTFVGFDRRQPVRRSDVAAGSGVTSCRGVCGLSGSGKAGGKGQPISGAAI